MVSYSAYKMQDFYHAELLLNLFDFECPKYSEVDYPKVATTGA